MTTLHIRRKALLFVLGTLPLLGQVSRPVIDTVVAAPTVTTTLPDHKLVPNDLVSVSVFDEPEVSKPAVRVGDGRQHCDAAPGKSNESGGFASPGTRG